MCDWLVRQGGRQVGRRADRLLRGPSASDGSRGRSCLAPLTRICRLTFATLPTRAEDSTLMRLAGVVLLACAGIAPAANLADADKLLKQIKAVSKEGAGNQ